MLTTPDIEQGELAHWWPEVLPGGEAVLFTILKGRGAENMEIAVLDLATGEQKVLLAGGSNPHYASTGHIVYGVDGTLRAVPFDLNRLELTGDPISVLEGVMSHAGGAVQFSLSADGSLVYGAAGPPGGAQRTLVWVDRQGREEPLALSPAPYQTVRLSPDGTRVVTDISGENPDLWVSDLARPGTLSRVTTEPAADFSPLWTPDGERVVFSSSREGPWGLFWKAADDRGDVERLVTVEDAAIFPYGWSPDGETLVVTTRSPNTGNDLSVVSMEGERAWEPLLHTEASESTPAISPDGQWIAYTSDETGQPEVYVERFPALGDRQQISTGGGSGPLWSPDGDELFYGRLGDGAMMVVPIDTEPAFTLGIPEVLFEGRYFQGNRRPYDLAPNSQRFLMIKPGTETDETASFPPQIILVLNWHQELLERVPVP